MLEGETTHTFLSLPVSTCAAAAFTLIWQHPILVLKVIEKCHSDLSVQIHFFFITTLPQQLNRETQRGILFYTHNCNRKINSLYLTNSDVWSLTSVFRWNIMMKYIFAQNDDCRSCPPLLMLWVQLERTTIPLDYRKQHLEKMRSSSSIPQWPGCNVDV